MRPFLRSAIQATLLSVGLLGAHLVLDAALGLDTLESGPIEWLQLGVLLLAAGLWLAVGIAGPGAPPRWRALAPVLAGGCLTGIGRETTWGRIWGAPAELETALTALNVVAFLVLAGLSAVRILRLRKPRAEGAVRPADSPAAILAVGAAVFLFSDLMENHVVGVSNPQLWEEALELGAFALLGFAAHAARLARGARSTPV